MCAKYLHVACAERILSMENINRIEQRDNGGIESAPHAANV